MGYKVWELIGDQAQLSRWNRVLSQAGEMLVSNDQANAQFQEHIDSSRTIIRSIIRHTMRKHPESNGFKDYESELLSVKCPKEYTENFWVVDFTDVMKKVLETLVQWNTDSDVVAAMQSLNSAEQLREQLHVLGLEPDLDPIEINAENRKKFFRILEDVQKVALAWCIREDTHVGIWKEDKESFESKLLDDFAKDAFLDIWDEEICFKLIGKLKQSQIHEGFWTALGASSTVIELMDELGISEAQLTEARNQLDERKHKQEIQKKTVEVCGTNFVNSEDNLNNLWDHILDAIKDDNLPLAELSHLEELKEQGEAKKRKKGDKKPTNNKKPKGRMSQAMKDLVGLAGEIHAFRALQSTYGNKTVGPGSWISENSRNKFPENSTNDGYGCDFVIHHNGKIHYVEVKATQLEDEAFELGSSEVELAIDCANRTKKKFVILHVLNALSTNPQLRFLPNPYDRKYKDKYKFEEAGLRVRYEIT